MNFGKFIVKSRKLIILISLILMIPAVIGIASTRINYDMLTYLPEDMDTVIGQNILMDEFGKGAFSFITVEGMSEKDVDKMCDELKDVEHVETVLWYSSLADISIPMELIPEKIYDAFNSEDGATLIALFFDTSTSADATMEAIKDVRSIVGENCYVSGMSALVTDLKDLCEQEEPIYVAIAVVLALIVMIVLLDNFLAPILFLVSIGMMILLNLGTNLFLGEISYITKALSAVLQLAVTMDYSIFLWNSYKEEKQKASDNKEAMALAINKTLTSVVGSSVTTIAGFIALCFMSYTLGKDLGIVMAKGVVFGVIGCVTVLPSLILMFDKLLAKCSHKSVIPNMDKAASFIINRKALFLVLIVIIGVPSYVGYKKANNEVYYDMISTLPGDMECVIANSKLKDEFDIASTHMVLIDSSLDSKDVRAMISKMEKVEGVKYVLGIESVIGSSIPEEMIPSSIKEILESDNYELLLINSEHKVGTDAANEEVEKLINIIKEYDSEGMLIGEAPCMKDLIETTSTDFRIVNIVSILAIFVIIALVEKSLSLPVILISVIEVAIFINFGIAHYTGVSLPFIAPICVSTIQLGATVDYAILMTTRYKQERLEGKDKKESVHIALATSIPSIIVSGLGLFSATFGVTVYSNIDIISAICLLLARGAIVSILCVVLVFPCLLYIFDKLIIHTTLDLRKGLLK